MAYYDFFISNVGNSDFENNEYIYGSCHSMCPENEINLRTREKYVHVLETVGDEKKLVKIYKRSAADTNMAVPSMLRPFPVLKQTIEYLLLEVTKRADVPAVVVYDFVSDRLRAVRQDMVIQRLPPQQCVELLEPMIRFHVLFAYHLYDLPLKEYDPILNSKFVIECQKLLLKCYDEMDKQSKSLDGLVGSLQKLGIKNDAKFSYDRMLMEKLYILCNMCDVHPIIRYLNLPAHLKRQRSLAEAYSLAKAYSEGNYIFIQHMVQKLCPLSYCAFFLHLPLFQRFGLRIMSVAYSCKRTCVPARVVAAWLHLSDDAETTDVCRHYGIHTEQGLVYFDRTKFLIEAPLHKIAKHRDHESKLNLELEHVFKYTTDTLYDQK